MGLCRPEIHKLCLPSLCPSAPCPYTLDELQRISGYFTASHDHVVHCAEPDFVDSFSPGEHIFPHLVDLSMVISLCAIGLPSTKSWCSRILPSAFLRFRMDESHPWFGCTTGSIFL